MKKLCCGLIVSVLVGCGSLNKAYVDADRSTWKAMQPCIEAGISAVGSRSLNGRAWSLLNRSWDGRILAAEVSSE